MKINIFKYALIAVATVGLSSCAHFLDTPTDTRVELTNPEQLRMLMNASYPQANYAWVGEVMSDNVEDNNTPDADGLRYNLPSYDRGDDEMFRFDQCVSSSRSDSPYGIWEAMYNSIAACNHVLEAAEKIGKQDLSTADRAKLNAVTGEALMLRSYCHFILAQMFCMPYGGVEKSKGLQGIFYADTPETTVKPDYERPTLAYTYERIVKDFEDGIKLISNTLYDQPKYHFNLTASYAYGARLFLFMRQYNKAFNYANMALGAPKVEDVEVANPSLRTDPSLFLSDVYSKKGSFFNLSDLGYYQNGSDKQWNFLLYPTYSIALRHQSDGYRYAKIRNALNSTMHGASPAWSRFKWSSSSGKGSSFCMHPCFNPTYINGKSEYGYWCGENIQEFFEYTDKVSGIGYAHETRKEFFGEETLLVRAEAALFLGDSNAALADLDVWEKNRRKCPSAVGKEDTFVDLTIANINDFYVTTLPADRNTSAGYDNGYGIAKEIHIDQICPETDAKVDFKSVEGMLQCIQHFRRIETLETGMRWFDIKRFGLEYSHVVGKEKEVYHLDIEDPRKAVQIPADVVAAGFQPNVRPENLTVKNNTEKAVPIN